MDRRTWLKRLAAGGVAGAVLLRDFGRLPTASTFAQSTATSVSSEAQTFADLKLSYNRVGDQTPVGGISGSAFFINPHTALIAHHVLNRTAYKPNEGYRYCQYWLLSRNNVVIAFGKDAISDYPQVDTTLIKFSRPQSDVRPYSLSVAAPRAEELVYSCGYVGDRMPRIEARWGERHLLIGKCDLAGLIADREGIIRALKVMRVTSKDIGLNDVRGIETSFGGVIGMSGGPLLRKTDNQLIGLMSIGLPADAQEKHTLFAIDIREITSAVRS